jgi:beta-fructofuranosidase
VSVRFLRLLAFVLCTTLFACLAPSVDAQTVPPNPNWPTYHFISSAGWLGEANGPVHYKGWYHMFHQHGLPGQGVNWGHARSRDLIDWELLPSALEPVSGESDCFSGAAFITDAGPRLIYTSRPAFDQRGAIAVDDDLTQWKRMPEIAMPHSLHEGIDIAAWRDIQIIDRDGVYYGIIGGVDLDKGRGAVTLFRARDGELAQWEYLGVMFYPPDSPDCAQPALFYLGDDKWALFMSRHKPHVEDWFVGKWNMETNKFEPQSCGALGYNEATYGTHGLYHPEDERAIYWNTHHSWRRNPGRFDIDVWPGCLSLPRVLTLSDDNQVLQEPMPELLQRLRGKHYHIEGFELDDANKLLDVKGDTLEIRVTIEPEDAESFGITVRRSADGARGMVLRYSDTFYVDGEEMMYSVAHGKENDPVRKPFLLKEGEPLELVVFLDKMVFEAYVNKRQCYDRLIHEVDHNADKELAVPQAEDLGIEVFSEGGTVTIKSIDIWEMNPIVLKLSSN